MVFLQIKTFSNFFCLDHKYSLSGTIILEQDRITMSLNIVFNATVYI